MSAIGGDDSIRLLPYYDLEVVRANPKVFLGYSDTTVTHMACFKAGLTSFYGPAIMAGFAENGAKFVEYDEAILTVVRDEQGLADLPIITGMDFGHTDPIMTLPLGVRAEIDCDLQELRITESAVASLKA